MGIVSLITIPLYDFHNKLFLLGISVDGNKLRIASGKVSLLTISYKSFSYEGIYAKVNKEKRSSHNVYTRDGYLAENYSER